MAIISYAWTTPQYDLCIKNMTRRKWKQAYLERWQKWFDDGKIIHQAWDKVPYAGGSYLGDIRLTKRPYLQKLRDMPYLDLIREGGMCLTHEGFNDLVGLTPDDEVSVIPFVRVFYQKSLVFSIYHKNKSRFHLEEGFSGNLSLFYKVGGNFELTAVSVQQEEVKNGRK